MFFNSFICSCWLSICFVPVPSISNATNFSYLTALYPLSLSTTSSGNTASISCAITPISLPVCTSCLSFQSNE
jgi:hypothetical protein